MSNHLPPGAIPKLFRQKVNGKEIGSWYIRIDKKPINLRTTDYMIARDRAREAWENGKRDFPDGRNDERLALPPMPAKERDETPIIELPQFEQSAGNWAADVAAAAGAGIKPEVFPPSQPPVIETKATDANAEYGSPKTKPPASDDTTEIDPEMIEDLANQMALGLVELQLMLQDWLARKTLKIKMGEVPEMQGGQVHKARMVPANVWKKWLKSLVPDDLPIPPYLAAPLLCAAMTIPVQLEGATALKPQPTDNPNPDIPRAKAE